MLQHDVKTRTDQRNGDGHREDLPPVVAPRSSRGEQDRARPQLARAVSHAKDATGLRSRPLHPLPCEPYSHLSGTHASAAEADGPTCWASQSLSGSTVARKPATFVRAAGVPSQGSTGHCFQA
jgi:hypothetical protein